MIWVVLYLLIGAAFTGEISRLNSPGEQGDPGIVFRFIVWLLVAAMWPIPFAMFLLFVAKEIRMRAHD